VRWLLANGLFDELNLMLHPIVVGHGQRLFEDTPTQPLQLMHDETFEAACCTRHTSQRKVPPNANRDFKGRQPHRL
jgi:dihydrofolate reductase